MARARSAKEAKSAVMVGALVLTGVFEFLEGVEAGEAPIKAASDAMKRTKVRGKAIQRAAKRAKKELAKLEEGDS